MCLRIVRGPGVSTQAPVTTGVLASSGRRSVGIGVTSTSSISLSGFGTVGAIGSFEVFFASSSSSCCVDTGSVGISGSGSSLYVCCSICAEAGRDSIATGCDKLFNWLAGAVCGRDASTRPGLGVFDALASRRSRSCESSLRCRSGLDGRGRVPETASCSHTLTVSVLVLYTATGEFSLPVPVTGCDFPIACHEFVLVRSRFPGEDEPCAVGSPISASFVGGGTRGRRELSDGLSGMVSAFKLSASLCRISSSIVFRGMYGVEAIIEASFSSKVRSHSADRSWRGVLLCDSGLSSIDGRARLSSIWSSYRPFTVSSARGGVCACSSYVIVLIQFRFDLLFLPHPAGACMAGSERAEPLLLGGLWNFTCAFVSATAWLRALFRSRLSRVRPTRGCVRAFLKACTLLPLCSASFNRRSSRAFCIMRLSKSSSASWELKSCMSSCSSMAASLWVVVIWAWRVLESTSDNRVSSARD